MGPKGEQRTMRNKVFSGMIYEICKIYIDDILIHGKSDPEFLDNLHRVFDRLHDKKFAVNPRKTELGLKEVEYVGHLVSATGTSFTLEKRLKVLDFLQPTTKCSNSSDSRYFRDHVPNMTEMVKPFTRHDPSCQKPEDRQADLDSRRLCRL